jgi:hypothetical protein
VNFLLSSVSNLLVKLFAYILSVYVMALMVLPCIDMPMDNTLHKAEILHSNNSFDHPGDADHCSPFCTCQCCQTNFFLADIPTVLPLAELTVSYNEFSPTLQGFDPFDFLVPPKS